jgi:hypothetical protein
VGETEAPTERDGDVVEEASTDASCSHQVPVNVGMYYAVYYDETFYIGRIESWKSESEVNVKFLKMDALTEIFTWLKKDDLAPVHKNFIFFSTPQHQRVLQVQNQKPPGSAKGIPFLQEESEWHLRNIELDQAKPVWLLRGKFVFEVLL